MKKKNLAILLLLPYLISLLGVITVNLTFKTFANDISHIEWDYSDIEVFKLADTRYRLDAKGVTSNNTLLADGNNLVWRVENQDGTDEPYARIEEENGVFYLVPLKEGTVTISCSNEKGNISRHTTAIIYLNSVIVVRTAVQSSQNNIDPTVYYGEYDLRNGEKVPAEIKLDVLCVPESLSQTLKVETQQNLKYDIPTSTIKNLTEGPATLTLSAGVEEDNTKTSFTFQFNVVDNGVNVYTYEDLLNCTNRSQNGEIVVLRKSFESVANTYETNNKGALKLVDGNPVKKANNVECFGTYDHTTDRYGFAAEVYRFETTYNHSYIDQWNAFAKNNSEYREISDMINVGIHVQKDFYGNGYTLNLHNLTYPYDTIDGKDAETGETIPVPYLRSDNVFRGPLPFYTLGDPNGMPMVSVYGQDNIGMYVEGNNVKINDVNLRNCDFGNSFSNLDYVGTVLEVHGDNVTVKNSVLQNGKNVMRAYSSENTVLENCMLQNARNFLLMAGCNEYVPIDGNREITFKDAGGNSVTTTLDAYLAKQAEGDSFLQNYLLGGLDRNVAEATLSALQATLNDTGATQIPYGGSITVKDSLFYRSGIASIAMESFFNGPFLYNGAPSLIGELFSTMSEEGSSKPLVPLIPEQVSGVSYPVRMNITGATKFYDYKTAEDLDLSGLIKENISTIVQSLLDALGESSEVKITIDDIFPLKAMLYQTAADPANKCIYQADGKSYLNIPVAFYGGGLNLSTVSFEGLEDADCIAADMDVDWVEKYLEMPPVNQSNALSMLPGVMQKTVTIVTGFEPFRFVCTKGNGYLFGATPNVSDLRNNLKG